MVKTGVVEGTVKTASADNAGDAVGAAAKCIASARDSVSALAEEIASLKKEIKDFKEAGK